MFSFEGIGLVIPITESMKDPHKFPKVLSGVMVGIMFLFAGGGALSYLAYGKDIQVCCDVAHSQCRRETDTVRASFVQTVVFVNLPQDDKFVNAAQFLYSLAILLSTPLQLFPAVRIMENGIFSRSGKHSNKVKWEKNGFRTAVVIACAGIAWAGASDLDKFVSLIGSLACVPLCFVYREPTSSILFASYDSLNSCTTSPTYSRVAPLQSVRAHAQTKDPRHRFAPVWNCRCDLHDFTDREHLSSSSSRPCS